MNRFVLMMVFSLALHARAGAADFQCTIKAETRQWSEGNPIMVEVTLKNISETPLDLAGTWAFELKSIKTESPAARYWCPVEMSDATSLKLPADGKVPKNLLHLDTGESKTFKFDLSILLWDRIISSRWPSKKLFETAPKGRYELVWRIDIAPGSRPTSNKVTVELK